MNTDAITVIENTDSPEVKVLWPMVSQTVTELEAVDAALGTSGRKALTAAEVVKVARESEDEEVQGVLAQFERAQKSLATIQGKLKALVDPTPEVNEDAVKDLRTQRREKRASLRNFLEAIGMVAERYELEDVAAAVETLKDEITPKQSTSRNDLSAARTWLRENGYEVNERGRISAELVAKLPEELR